MTVAVSPPSISMPAPAGVALDSASLVDVIRALCLAAARPRFAISPEVVASTKKLTVVLAGSSDGVWSQGIEALQLAGVRGHCRRSLCSFGLVPDSKNGQVPAIAQSVLAYSPRFRDVAFLAGQMTPLFSSWRFSGGATSAAGSSNSSVSAVSASSGSSGPADGSARAQESVPTDLVGIGPSSERSRVVSLVEQLDQPVPSLVVRVAVYEVDTSSADQSAIGVVGGILKSSAQLGGSAAMSAATGGLATLNLNLGSGFSAVIAALDNSSSAHLVTSPVLRALSGTLASFAVGDSVPTLGSVSYAGTSSTAVQSIAYQQSGVVFSVLPTVVGDHVEVALYQSISSFVATATGVTSSPTLQNRALSSQLEVKPGEVLVLGGLMQTSDTVTDTGWWIFPKLDKTASKSKSSLVLVLSVEEPQAGSQAGGR